MPLELRQEVSAMTLVGQLTTEHWKRHVLRAAHKAAMWDDLNWYWSDKRADQTNAFPGFTLWVELYLQFFGDHYKLVGYIVSLPKDDENLEAADAEVANPVLGGRL